MRRASLILLALGALVVLGLLSSIVTHGFDEMAAAEEERDRLQQRTAKLSESIGELEETLEAIRTDPAAVVNKIRRGARPCSKSLFNHEEHEVHEGI